MKLVCFRFPLFAFRFSFFDIRTETKYRVFVFRFTLFAFRHSKWGVISNFNIRNPISTFELRPNIVFWHSKSYFDIWTEAEYRILTFETLFWHSNWDGISYFDIRNPNLTFELKSNTVFLHSKCYFDIRTKAEYRILTFEILFWYSNSSRISYFDIRNPILTFKLGRISNFDNRNPILTFELRPNNVFLHSKSYFNIQTEAKYRILAFEILFWHSNWGQISYFNIQNFILTTSFWHSQRGRISKLDNRNAMLTFELSPNFVFWHSKSYFDIRFQPIIVFWQSKSHFDILIDEYRILTFEILFWHSN